MENKIENNIKNIYDENNVESPSDLSTNQDYIPDSSSTTPESENHINDENIDNSNIANDTITENNTSNCLALTIKEDYKLTSKTNVLLRSLRMTFKVFVSYVTLNIIKLFF